MCCAHLWCPRTHHEVKLSLPKKTLLFTCYVIYYFLNYFARENRRCFLELPIECGVYCTAHTVITIIFGLLNLHENLSRFRVSRIKSIVSNVCTTCVYSWRLGFDLQKKTQPLCTCYKINFFIETDTLRN